MSDTTERDKLARVIARTFGGWNDDITEPGISDPVHRAHMEQHWRDVNESCLKQGRTIADAIRCPEHRTKHTSREPMSNAEYTPTDEEVIRGYRMPVTVLAPRRSGESFAEYLGRESIDANVHQMASEAAFRRWLATHDAEVRAAQREKDAQIAFKVAGGEPINSSNPHDWVGWKRTGRRIGIDIQEQGSE